MTDDDFREENTGEAMLEMESKGKTVWLQVRVLEVTRSWKRHEGSPPEFHYPVHILVPGP